MRSGSIRRSAIDTHWSRLIDAGLAGFFLASRPFAAPIIAETAHARGVAAGVAARRDGRCRGAGVADRRPQRRASLALVVCACALPAFQHFKPGRIDHHNVQIALALAVVAAAAWSDRARHAAALAGALTGLAVAVGLEGLPFS